MGSQISRIEDRLSEDEVKGSTTVTESTPPTPILSPVDPRSPSTNIARTPLELVLASKLHQESEEESIIEEKKDLVKMALGIDPRSPTTEFNRTPIIVTTAVKPKLINKNLKNLNQPAVETTPISSKVVSPKLLGSSPISVSTNVEKRKSFVGLLETNIDFTETDLDSVYQAKTSLNQSLPINVTEETVSMVDNKLKEQVEALQIESLKEDPTDTVQANKEMNITGRVKDFDKKLSNLIYEEASDSDSNFNSKPVNKLHNVNNRTPLGVMNCNEKPKNRLKVSDKPRKSGGSKIPVMKDLQGKRISVQCENTPPRKLEEKRIKTKFTHWDSDKTLII